MTGRLLIVLLVLSTSVALRQPALTEPTAPSAQTPTRAHWSQRLAVDLSRAITRTTLLQRVTLLSPPPLAVRTPAPAMLPPPALRLNVYHLGLPPPLV